jgi:hypothetical protein
LELISRKAITMDKLTENQFYTVWTKAVGMVEYNKSLFQNLLAQLKHEGLILENKKEPHSNGDKLKAEQIKKSVIEVMLIIKRANLVEIDKYPCNSEMRLMSNIVSSEITALENELKIIQKGNNESQLQQAEDRGRVDGFGKGKWLSAWCVAMNLPYIDPNGRLGKAMGNLMDEIKKLNVEEDEKGWQTYKKYHPEISQLTKGE